MALASPWLHRQRMAKVLPYLEAPVLDVGCGDCSARAYAASGYVGIDRDRSFLPHDAGAPERMEGTADLLPFRDGSFQTVLAMAVMEHVSDPVACLREAARVLRPRGRIVLTTPTPMGDHLHHWLARVGVTSRHAADEHQSVMGPRELKRAVEDAGLHVEKFNVFLFGGNQVCVATAPARAIPATDTNAASASVAA